MFGSFGRKKPRRDLTVGLIQGNRPIVEKVIRGREKVTIGTDSKNTFVIQSPKLPKRFTVFEPQAEDRRLLYFLGFMTGKIAVNETAAPFSALLEKGIVETKHGVHSISISDKTRGRILFDDCRLLFRFDDPTS